MKYQGSNGKTHLQRKDQSTPVGNILHRTP